MSSGLHRKKSVQKISKQKIKQHKEHLILRKIFAGILKGEVWEELGGEEMDKYYIKFSKN